MKKYHVEVSELIREIRTYEVEASSSREAAEMVRGMWVDGGEEQHPPQIEVVERDYDVALSGGDHVASYGCSEIEL